MAELSHTDKQGKARMVDVSRKKDQLRIAKAEGSIRLSREAVLLVRENQVKKGDVLTVAQIAGIQAAKRTGDMIPLCHPLNLTNVMVRCELTDVGVNATGEVHCIGPTGVEMEALTAVTVALLTVYDMCKGVDKNMVIDRIQLVSKTKEDIDR